jgi:uncharacterized protein YegP (UPF0339 family)
MTLTDRIRAWYRDRRDIAFGNAYLQRCNECATQQWCDGPCSTPKDGEGRPLASLHPKYPNVYWDEQFKQWREQLRKPKSRPMSHPSTWIYGDGTSVVKPKEERSMKVGRFQIFEDKQRKYRWRLRAANGRIVAQSEAYTRKYDAVRAVQAIDKALHPGYIVEIPE